MNNVENIDVVEEFEDIAIEELGDLAGAGTTNTGGTFGSTTCPACVGTAFSFS
ncbi:RiPP peptide [Kitasatospora sp. NPDC093558]|uniref:RiPP peptide n=1 Tax=Kitasatospora sp. NPDC093558 TaxID=3155201 RepID=UPI00342D8E2B